MSGGGSSPPAQPSTTTQVQDIPAWEQGYVTNLLGQAQTLAAQPYQQFNGPQVAGFTEDQSQAFSNVENMPGTYQPTTNAAINSANAGATTAGNIYGAGAGMVNASTGYNPLSAVSPYLGAASGYNAASAAQPWLNNSAVYSNASANAATPGGIQSYMSPYTSSVVQGIQNEANQNWNQNIMPGINDNFVGTGQYGSGRNAQVLGEAAGNFQTGLSANVANALESGYGMAGSQAANEAGILGNAANTSLSGANTAGGEQTAQIGNLLNQAGTAGTATQQQGANLLNAGNALGNLTSTQGAQELNAANTLGNLSNVQQQQGLTQAQALQGVGQEQQQLNQANLNTAQQNFYNQTQYPEQQTQYLNQIIRGLPAPSATTSGSQITPAYSVSPLSGIGGAGIGALSLTGANGSLLGSAQGRKTGGLIKGYAKGRQVDAYDPLDDIQSEYDTPLSYADHDADADAQPEGDYKPSLDTSGIDALANTPLAAASVPEAAAATSAGSAPMNPLAPDISVPQYKGMSDSQQQQMQLLALARGMLTPSLGGSTAAAMGQGLGNLQEMQLAQQKMNMQQQQANFDNQIKKASLEQEAPLKSAQASYYQQGAGTGSKAVSVIGPDGKPVLMPAREAIANGYSPTAGYAANVTTLSPAAIKQQADSIATTGKVPTGLGIGMNGNKKAILDQLAQDHPDVNLGDVQAQFAGETSAARTVGSTSGRIEFASESLGSMIPLARQASKEVDRTQYPSINAIQNAVEKGTGDTKIIALNTYLNAVIGDQAQLIARSGVSTDAARATARDSANAAFTDGQLDKYFDAVTNEIKAQRSAGKAAMASVTSLNKPSADVPAAAPQQSDRVAALLAAKAKLGAQ